MGRSAASAEPVKLAVSAMARRVFFIFVSETLAVRTDISVRRHVVT
jgi:hypothetical protein